MAEELEIKITADTSGLQAGTQEATDSVNELESNVSSSGSEMESTLGKVGKAFASAFSLKVVTNFIKECTELYNTQFEAETKYTTIAKSRLGLTDEQIAQNEQLASVYQSQGIFGDEAILTAQATAGALLTSGEALDILTQASLDLTAGVYGASATSENLESTLQGVANACSTGTWSAKKLGISLGDMEEAWNNATTEEERAQIASQVIEETYAGMNETMRETPVGSVTAMNNALGDCKEVIGQTLAPVISKVAEKVESFFVFCQNNSWVLKTIAIAIGLITVALGAYSVATAISAIATDALLLPIMAVVAGIVALIAVIVLCVEHWDEIKEVASEVIDKIVSKVKEMVEKVKEKITAMKETVDTIVESIKNKVMDKFTQIKTDITDKFNAVKDTVTSIFTNIKDTIKSKIDGAREAVKTAIDKIKSFFNFSWSLPHLSLPHISISGNFSLNPLSVPHFSIDWYKNGGVFDATTLFTYGNQIGGLGEAGAEAIVPLEETKWVDVIAERLAGQLTNSGSTTPIVLEVDGKVFAQTAVKTINNLTRQTGSLGLRLA